jgi:hypothetical protein
VRGCCTVVVLVLYKNQIKEKGREGVVGEGGAAHGLWVFFMWAGLLINRNGLGCYVGINKIGPQIINANFRQNQGTIFHEYFRILNEVQKL